MNPFSGPDVIYIIGVTFLNPRKGDRWSKSKGFLRSDLRKRHTFLIVKQIFSLHPLLTCFQSKDYYTNR